MPAKVGEKQVTFTEERYDSIVYLVCSCPVADVATVSALGDPSHLSCFFDTQPERLARKGDL